MSMKHANSLTMLEQDVLNLAIKSPNKAVTGEEIAQHCKASPERVQRAISYLTWRETVRKEKRKGLKL